MDTNTTIIIVVLILAAVAIFGFMRFRQSGKASLKGPFGTSVDVEGSNESTPGAQIIDSKSKKGGATAEASRGSALIQRTEVEQDLTARSGLPPGDSTPKA